MWKSKVLAIIVLVMYFLFVYFQINGNDELASRFKVFLVPLIAIGYFFCEKKKTLFFSFFILFYAVSELLDLAVDHFDYNVYYYIGNALYMFAYSFLVIQVLKSLSFRFVIKNFKIHLIVLTILNLYLLYVLQVIVGPYTFEVGKYYYELLYHGILVLLLSSTLLNYLYKENQKSLYLFVGALFIVFSEALLLAHFYIVERGVLIIISATLGLAAFYCFYRQTQLANNNGEDMLSVQ